MVVVTAKLRARNCDGYPAPAGVTVDVVVLTVIGPSLHVLTVKRSDAPFKGRRALPGGFWNDEEQAAEVAQRKLTEKTGMGPVHLEKLSFYADLSRDRRGWIPSLAYLALVPSSSLPPDAGAAWVPVDSAGPLAFDHGQMLADALELVERRLWASNIAFALLPETFALSEARGVYEAVARRRYDGASFARDLKRSGLIEPAQHARSGGRGRPAALYRFKARRLQPAPARRRRAG